MRQSTLSAAEIADRDESNKKETRKSGFSLMSVRDRGFNTLSNGVTVCWNHPKYEGDVSVTDDGLEVSTVYKSKVPNGKFGMQIGRQFIEFDAEELMRHLRWA